MDLSDTDPEIEHLIAEALPELRQMAREELAKRRGKVVMINLPEFVKPLGWLRLQIYGLSEHDYRRGYRHGYSQGMDDVLAAGKRSKAVLSAWERVAEFFDGSLCQWAYCDKIRGQTPPPSFQREAA